MTHNTVWLLWLPVALFMLTSAAVAPDDYDITPLEDPLQPIWNRLDSLSSDMVNGFMTQRESLSQMQSKLEEKFGALMSRVTLKMTAINNMIMNNQGQVDNKVIQMNSTLTSWLHNFYQDHMLVDSEERMQKIEQHVDVKVAGLENRIDSALGALEGRVRTTSGSNSTPVGGTIPSGSTADMERRIITQVTSAVTSLETGVREQLTGLTQNVDTINTHVTKINERMSLGGGEVEGESGGESGFCRTLEDKVSELLNNGGSQGTCSCLSQEIVGNITSALNRVIDTPAFLPRDCSDLHWQSPEAPSGVFLTYPNMDSKSPVSAWCDMGGEESNKDEGGWTVILRRRESDFGQVLFNRSWDEYRQGFGDPSEGEWWYGLASIHALTYRQPYEALFLLHDIEQGSFYAKYTTFRVEDELNKFRLVVGGFSGNVTIDSLASKHHNSPFSTWDQDNDEWGTGSCAVSNSGGWWFNACHYTTLTAPLPTSNNRTAKTIRWRTDDAWLVFNDVTVQIRPTNYAQRFNAQD
ncbi:angiopoietin-related protein 4-like [Homarus americanus]|uniref:Fibrinogen-like protein 1-like 3 n=1 Tax=Homarus americanus TaxID=6706 RepID=A0A8J5NAK9_HOMAM|nr:angiopoietin-related protein 4-like [Homarus americanus]KAG7175929.1 Fibrinogen-like protein 1-like 3 [Homarus americanus]